MAEVEQMPVTYFTSADRGFFPGVVALVNSIRLTGNRGEIVVFDVGLDPHQRRRLSAVATVETPPVIPPCSKVMPPPDVRGLTVAIDSDVLVVASLDGILEAAERGQICVYPDPAERWCGEWRDLFELRAPLRRERYVNAGFVALSSEHRSDFWVRWSAAIARLPPLRPDSLNDPARWLDQDALNALLMSEIDEGQLLRLPELEQSHPPTLRDVDIREHDLRCSYQGSRVTLLHHSMRPKVWETKGYRRDFAQAYVRLLPRVLFGDDVALQLDFDEVPLWLRPTIAGRLALRAGKLGHSRPSVKRAVSSFARKPGKQRRTS